MSQYTVSLRAYINLIDEFTNSRATFADVEKKIALGRQIFFNFDYDASPAFKELFETAFILHNFDNDIYCNDIDKFKIRLKNDVIIKIPMYYKAWLDINNKYSILQNGSYTDNATDSATESAHNTSSASASGKDKTLGSSFPNDIERATDADDVKYMNSGTIGKNSSESKSSGSSDVNRESSRTVEHVEIGNIFDKLRELEKQSVDIINTAVGSFSNLFMIVW